jgi:cell division septation protein DedD
VPELSHDTADDGFHEIQLSGKQLVFLFIVTTSVVVGVFLFGVLVGRGAREPKTEEPAPVGAIETAPAAPVTQAGPPAIEPPAPAADAPSDNAAPKGQTPAPKAVEESKPAAAVHEPVKEPPAPPPATSPAPAKPAAAAGAPAKSPEPAPTAAAPSVPTTARPGTWLVQVMATREQGIATSLVKKLAAKGYPAFLVNPVPGAPQAFYKVQIGRYKDRSEAERVSVRIKKEEQFQSWILR